MAIKRILVTGSSGTIGTRLCEKLLEQGYEVTGLDLQRNKWSDAVNKITIIGDLREALSLERLQKGFDIIIHLAANARVYNLVLEPELALDNITTTFNVLEHCRKQGIKRIIIASSREIYGNTDKAVYSEDETQIERCEGPYAASKISGEALAHAYQNCYGIKFIILRFSNVYGMYDDSDRFVPLFIRLAEQGKDMTVFGEKKALDFTYIDDTIAGIILCVQNFQSASGEAYNLSAGRGVALTEVASLIRQELKANSKVLLAGNRTGEVIRFTADISKAEKRMGYKPTVPIEEGIKKSVGWYAANCPALSDSSKQHAK